jgi:Asp-tRNA(Asn)/Glu-tRNA(Gln) amidotransferase A subunit family amidase
MDETLAWVYRDAAPAAGAAGPLAGMRFGVKDNIDVLGMPTGYGLLDRTPRIASLDAWCVAALRAAGGVPLGKTHSTALASKDPAITRNPRIAGRTPGGSSAGSAAAVAAGHVPFALGTQTQGSVNRPAAFCGVVGFKPTYGLIPTGGVAPFAPSFDTVGIIADSVATATLVAGVLLPIALAYAFDGPIALGWAPATFADRFTPATRAALDAFVGLLDAAAFAVRPAHFAHIESMRDVTTTIMGYEAHATLAPFRAAGPLPPGVDAFIAGGASVGYDAYRAAQTERARLGGEASDVMAHFDAVMIPIADEPPGPDTTGDPLPQAAWTAWGMPSLALPIGTLDSGAPVSIGIVAPAGDDAIVLEVARRLEALGNR